MDNSIELTDLIINISSTLTFITPIIIILICLRMSIMYKWWWLFLSPIWLLFYLIFNVNFFAHLYSEGNKTSYADHTDLGMFTGILIGNIFLLLILFAASNIYISIYACDEGFNKSDTD